MLDAYVIRKAVPRLVIAVIGINLSIYLCVAAIDITNIIGRGLGELLVKPFVDANSFDALIEGNLTNGLVGGAGVAVGAGALTLAIAALPAVTAQSAIAVLAFILLFSLTFMLIAFAVFFTLIIRQGLIIFLTIISPIAIACSVLPGTEKYFRQWWDLFLKTLLVYPIIAAIFAMSDILGSIVLRAASSSPDGIGLAQIFAALAVLYVPLILIPFAFRFAGGALATIFSAASGTGTRLANFIKGDSANPYSLQNKVKRNTTAAVTRTRAQTVRANLRGREGDSRARNWGRRRIARVVGAGDVMSREAALNRQGMERMDQVKSTGDDTFGRALTSIPLYVDENGKYTTENTGIRARDKRGNNLRQSLGGAEYTDDEYAKGSKLYQTLGERQAWAYYETTKIPDGYTENFKDNYLKWADQEGLSEQEAGGIYTGVAFSAQGERLNMKYSPIIKDSQTGKLEFADVSSPKMNFNPVTGQMGKNDAFIDDLYYKKGAYQTGQLSAEDIHRAYDIKEHMAGEIRRLQSSPDSPQRDAALENARKRLEQIQSLETTWDGSQGQAPALPPGATGDEAVASRYSGLSGGNQGIQDAFRSRAYREVQLEDGQSARRLNKYDLKTGERLRYADEKSKNP